MYYSEVRTRMYCIQCLYNRKVKKVQYEKVEMRTFLYLPIFGEVLRLLINFCASIFSINCSQVYSLSWLHRKRWAYSWTVLILQSAHLSSQEAKTACTTLPLLLMLWMAEGWTGVLVFLRMNVMSVCNYTFLSYNGLCSAPSKSH